MFCIICCLRSNHSDSPIRTQLLNYVAADQLVDKNGEIPGKSSRGWVSNLTLTWQMVLSQEFWSINKKTIFDPQSIAFVLGVSSTLTQPSDLHQQSGSRQPPAASPAVAAISLSAAYACLHSLAILPPLLIPDPKRWEEGRTCPTPPSQIYGSPGCDYLPWLIVVVGCVCFKQWPLAVCSECMFFQLWSVMQFNIHD